MDDSISRQAAIDEVARWAGYLDEDMITRIQIGLKRLPSTQTEIIRCNDCKYYEFADNRAFGFPVKRCEVTGFEDVDDDDFCSRAERRSDGSD